MQYSKLLSKPSGQVGLVSGVAAGVLFGVYIGIVLRSLVLGLTEGIIFGTIMGAFFAWRVREHARITSPVAAARLTHWTPMLTSAFWLGLFIFSALTVLNAVKHDAGVAIAWGVLGVLYLAIVVSVPVLNRRAAAERITS